MTEIRRVGVLGCGLMGSGIAQVAATAGCDTLVRDVSKQIWERARAGIENSLGKELDALCAAHTIFASNTSSLTIAAMAAATQRGDRFVGLHFFNPVPLMPLVEVVRTVTTSEIGRAH